MLTLLLLLACGGDDPAPATSTEEEASLADVLAGMQEGPPAPTAPKEGAPPREPTGLTEAPPPPEAAPPGSADCEAARGKREALERRVAQQEEGVVARAEESLNSAQAEMNRCIGDMECAMDGKRIQDVQNRVASAQGAYDRAQEQVGVLSAGFYEIDKEIRAACGR
ncbi:MAG: hypothetical protein H6741_19145 [Alphaproteobacteria bacterium]|nr:hypothetical protein [Alphaproteobacteria bacterium]MCB9794827.1 hypothetical protein [Alphaproteobacteria bacterium]